MESHFVEVTLNLKKANLYKIYVVYRIIILELILIGYLYILEYNYELNSYSRLNINILLIEMVNK